MTETFLPLVANWQAPVRETYSFLTEIFESRSGREQRRSHRKFPRRDLSFDFLVNSASTRALVAALTVRTENDMRVVDFTAPPSYLDQPASEGSTTLKIRLPRTWMTGSVPVGLVHGLNIGTDVISDLESLTDFNNDFNDDFGSGDLFTISVTGLDRSWPAGTMIYPLINGRVTEGLDMTFDTGNTARGTSVFRQTRGSNFQSTETPTQFADMDVFEFRPNWSTRPRVTFAAPEEEVDFTKGVTKTFKPVNFNSRRLQFSYLGIDREQVESMRDFFFRQNGRRGEFWCPSFIDDMLVTVGVNAGHTGFRVLGSNIASDFNDNVHQAVCVNFTDGTSHYAEVTGMVSENTQIGPTVTGDFNADYNEDFIPGVGLLGKQTYIQIQQPFPASKRKSEISSVSWLFVSRFGSDDLTIEWVTSKVGRTLVNLTTLEKV